MWRTLIFGLLLAVGTLGAASAQNADAPQSVSLVSLIADPVAYDGKRVRVAGYLTTTHFEDCSIYLSKDDFDHSITPNAVAVNWEGCFRKPRRGWTTWSILSGRYAVVEGTFRAGRPELLLRSRVGVVEDVTRITASQTRAEFVKQITVSWWRLYRLELAAGLLFVVLTSAAAYGIARAVQRSR